MFEIARAALLAWLFAHVEVPRFVLKWLMRRVAEEIEIEISSETRIEKSAARGPIPILVAVFRIANRSVVDLELERMSIEVLVGSPLLSGAILKRQVIPHRTGTIQASFWSALNETQVAQIDSARAGDFVVVLANVTVYFESPAWKGDRIVVVKQGLRNETVRIQGLTSS